MIKNVLVVNYFGVGEIIGGVNGYDLMLSMMNIWGILLGYVVGVVVSENV